MLNIFGWIRWDLASFFCGSRLTKWNPFNFVSLRFQGIQHGLIPKTILNSHLSTLLEFTSWSPFKGYLWVQLNSSQETCSNLLQAGTILQRIAWFTSWNFRSPKTSTSQQSCTSPLDDLVIYRSLSSFSIAVPSRDCSDSNPAILLNLTWLFPFQ